MTKKTVANTINIVRENAGQASVEAAIMLPIILFLCAFLTQPICLLYTKSQMISAAAEGIRLVSTMSSHVSQENAENFILMRLESIPNVGIFHSGGSDDWDINFNQDKDSVSLQIKGHVKPLPFLGAIVNVFSNKDAEGVILEEELTEKIYPEWREGDFDEWQKIWN